MLARHGRISNAELAAQVGLSPSPCLRRVRRLEDTGVIRGYRALIDPAAVGRGLRVFAGVRLMRHARADVVAFERAVVRLPEVVHTHHVTGPSVTGIGRRWGVGSGIVLGEGRVLTNAHNIRGTAVTVTFADGRTTEGNVAGHDVDGDLAVIETDTGQAAALPWATAAPAIGTAVFALANPGGRGLRVTFGTVSGIDRSFRGPRGLRISGSLEHTAPLLPGSSGGPVLDAEGQLLGINTNRLDEGFYLAIPADEALRGRVDALARGESVRPPQLGITITPGHMARRMRRAVGLPDAEGLLIRDVAEDSPAARADLTRGDLIVTAAGQSIHSADDLAAALRAAAGTIDLNVLRGTDERSIRVGLGQPEGSA